MNHEPLPLLTVQTRSEAPVASRRWQPLAVVQSLLLHALLLALLVWASQLPVGSPASPGARSVTAYLLAAPAVSVPVPSPPPVPVPATVPVETPPPAPHLRPEGERRAEPPPEPPPPAPAATASPTPEPVPTPAPPASVAEAPEVQDVAPAAGSSEGASATPATAETPAEDGLLQRLRARWLEPPNIHRGLECEVAVRVDGQGQIMAVTITRTSGNLEFDDSVVRALYKSSPLPPAERARARRGLLALTVSAAALE